MTKQVEISPSKMHSGFRNPIWIAQCAERINRKLKIDFWIIFHALSVQCQHFNHQRSHFLHNRPQNYISDIKGLILTTSQKMKHFWHNATAANPRARTANRMIIYAEAFFRSESVDTWSVQVYCASTTQHEVVLVQRPLPEVNRSLKKPIGILLKSSNFWAPKSHHVPHVWC